MCIRSFRVRKLTSLPGSEARMSPWGIYQQEQAYVFAVPSTHAIKTLHRCLCRPDPFCRDLHNNEKFVIISTMEEKMNAAERIIRRFGGQSALAALLGKRQSTIEHWARTGRVPAQWQMPLMSLGRQRGVILEAKDFVELKPNPIQP